jgi:phosphohistidine phosphatase SixA
VRSNLAVLFAFLLLLPVSAESVAAQTETLIFLVRHAERADDGPEGNRMALDPQMAEDPPLSAAGRDRADLLATMLSDAGITHIHSTDYRRTRETAAPTAGGTGIEIAVYDASDLEGFANKLRSTPGRHLVVGHSNTTPGLVRALGGDAGPPIEPLEYDRLYLLMVSESDARTILFRFGSGL